MSERVFALFAGGGTGGHTYPAIAVAQELVRRGHPPATLRFVGGRRGIEGRVVTDAGFSIDLLAGRGLQRRVTPANIAAIWGAFTAFVVALQLVRRYRPCVVVGFGGYASLPCVVAARALRVPTIVHDQDAVPGLANRIGVRLGARTAVSLPGTTLRNATLTGNPVRSSIAAIVRQPARDPALLAVYGGAQGARTINRAAIGCYDRWRDRSDMMVRHICGPRNQEECAAALDAQRREGDALAYELVPFEPHMETLLARATLAVCRAGAGTIAELTVAGVPAVLVPLSGSPGDHQVRNARTLEQAGAAVVVLDEDCDPPRLDAVVSELLAAPDRLDRMSAAARELGRPDAAARLADLVEEHARAG
ncbi:MAG: UDP-N-acetylglucosamine--N-acetylmuramyl-(pentapeptide) pyrophosphoryl-undecaprenol [Actinomycetota bacterium]|nr:UDP-N-acetylglucosamine--N-acetylmuramyl-(pentapeptide) pyrophosphoryl-undecaprenol [Actinomycetota bacterium]